MFGAGSIRFITHAIPIFGLLAIGLVAAPVGFAQTPTAEQGKVKVEWLGHQFFRLTSPKALSCSPALSSPIRMGPCRWNP